MDKSWTTVFFSCVLLLSLCVPPSLAQTCRGHTFSSNQVFTACSNLPVLSSFLYWNYYPSNLTADIAFRKAGASTNTWVAWALNPSGQQMVGSQAILAFHNSSGVPTAYTTPITSFSPSMQPGNLSFRVSNLKAEYSNGDMILFATLHLTSSLISTNQVWQEGSMSGTSFNSHAMDSENSASVGTINFETGATVAGSVGTSTKKNVHGALNAVSWGVLMPMGIMMARYLKVFKVANPAWFYLHAACQSSAYIIGVAGWGTGLKLGSDSPGIKYTKHRNIGITLFCFATLQALIEVSWGVLMPMGIMMARYLKAFKVANPAWFYLHAACQSSAYIIGVAGWGTGLKLGSDSPGINYTKHRNIGITLFCFATLQVFALLFRPKPDHKYRLYWNIYHHSIGYATIILSIINIYEGFDILDPEKKWKKIFTGIIILLGALAALLEVITWIIVLTRKKAVTSNKHVNGSA